MTLQVKQIVSKQEQVLIFLSLLPFWCVKACHRKLYRKFIKLSSFISRVFYYKNIAFNKFDFDRFNALHACIRKANKPLGFYDRSNTWIN